MRFDRLDGYVEPPRDLLVRVASSNQPKNLPLTLGQKVEFGIDGLRAFSCERIEHKPGEAGREDCVTVVHALYRAGEIHRGYGLGDVPARPRSHYRDHILRRIRYRQREELDVCRSSRDLLYDGSASAPRHVDVEKNDVREGRNDPCDCLIDIAGDPDDLELLSELGLNSRKEEAVIVDKEDADRHGRLADPERHSQLNLRPLAGCRVNLCPAPVALHPGVN